MKDGNTNFLLWKDVRGAILAIVYFLILLGCVNNYSAQFSQLGFSRIGFSLKYILIIGVGSLAMWALRKIGYKCLLNRRLIKWSTWATIGLLLLVFFVGEDINGAKRWISIGRFQFQPSELAKLVFIMASAYYLGSALERGKEVKPFSQECTFLTLCTGAAFIIVAKEPDLGTGAIIAAIVVCMYIIAGLSKDYIVGVLAFTAVAFAALVIAEPFRLRRFAVWFDPWIDERGAGFQMVQALKGIGSGGLTGKSWGLGMIKHEMPEPHTDFAFAVFCEENGFIGAMFLIIIYSLLAYAFFKVIAYARNKKGFMLACGLTILIIGQAISNMAMVCGVLPVIGVPLPFISYGGTSLVITLAAIGLILSVYDEEEKARKQEKISPEERRNQLHIYNPPTRRWPR